MMGYVAVIAASVAGLVLGTRYRVPALLAATAVFFVSSLAAGLAGQWSLGETLVWAVLLTVTMQAFYFAGVGLAHLFKSRRN